MSAVPGELLGGAMPIVSEYSKLCDLRVASYRREKKEFHTGFCSKSKGGRGGYFLNRELERDS